MQFKGKLNIYRIQYDWQATSDVFEITTEEYDNPSYFLVGQTDEMIVDIPEIESINGLRVAQLKKQKELVLANSLAAVEEINKKISELEAIEFKNE